MVPEKPRVVFVSTYPPEHCGIGRDTFLLAQSLREFRTVSIMANIVTGAALEEGNVSRVWRKNELLYPIKILARINRVSKPSDVIVHVFHHFHLYGGPPTVVLFPVLLLLLRIRGYRVVVHFHSVIDPGELRELKMPETERLPPWILAAGLRIFIRLVAGLADRIVVCTSAMRGVLIERYGLNPEPISVMPVGWYEVASPGIGADAKEALGLAKRQIIMFHSFLDPTKGLEDLLEAFAQVHSEFPDSHLVLAGEVAPSVGTAGQKFVSSLEKRVADLGLYGAVTFTGYQDEASLSRTLSAADVFVLPYTMLASLGGSGSLSRLAAFGKPLIASRISRFTDEIVDGETGLLVAPGRSEEIAAAIRRILSDPILANRLGNNLRKLATERTWRTSAELLDRKLYPSLKSLSPN